MTGPRAEILRNELPDRSARRVRKVLSARRDLLVDHAPSAPTT
jgi:hypothetical protein